MIPHQRIGRLLSHPSLSYAPVDRRSRAAKKFASFRVKIRDLVCCLPEDVRVFGRVRQWKVAERWWWLFWCGAGNEI